VAGCSPSEKTVGSVESARKMLEMLYVITARGEIMEKNKVQLAFNAWLQDYRTLAWKDLDPEERLILSSYHFERFWKELENI